MAKLNKYFGSVGVTLYLNGDVLVRLPKRPNHAHKALLDFMERQSGAKSYVSLAGHRCVRVPAKAEGK